MLAKLGAWVVAAALVVTSMAFAADNANEAALSPGKAAGVKKAEAIGQHQLLWLLGGGVVVGGVILVATGNGHGNVSCAVPGCTAPQTTTTNTAPR